MGENDAISEFASSELLITMLLVGSTEPVWELDRGLLDGESDLVAGSIVREESGLRTRKAFPFEFSFSCFSLTILRSGWQW